MQKLRKNPQFYKQTELGEIPTEWEQKSLPELCTVVKDGSHYSPPHQKSGYPLATANMKDNHVDIESCYRITQQDYELLVKSGCKVEIDDVLFSKDGTIGLCIVYNQAEPLVVLSSIAIIRPKSTILNPYFLSYILQSSYIMKKILGTKTGTALTRIIVRDIRRVKVPVPNLSEQQKIVSILSKTDELIQKTDKVVEQTQRLEKRLMQRLLTKGIGHTRFKKSDLGEIPEEWQQITIDKIIKNRDDIKTGPFGSSLKKEIFVSSGYKVYGQENVIPDDFTIGNYYVSEETFAKMKKYEIKPGDI